MADVSIVIVTYNSSDSIGRLLRSIEPAYPGGTPHIVVVDNGSTDDTVAIVSEFPRVELVNSSNEGYAAGINKGIERGRGVDAYLVLNPDLELLPGAIPALLAELGTPGVGIAAPKVLSIDGAVERSQRREPTLLRAIGLSFTRLALFSEYVQDETAYSQVQDVDWALGAALMIARQCSDDVGRWDESFFLYSEETDYCARARAAGWAVRFTPHATAVHAGGGSGRNDRTHTMQIINKVRYYARGHSAAAGLAYWAVTILSELTWIARGHRQSIASVRALLRPSERPAELGCGATLIPR